MSECKIISLSADNIDKEHICCAMSDKKSKAGVDEKKEWLSERFKEGLKFKKFDIRGKVFIEYIPAEKAWEPITAPGYTFINCHWVAGSYKGNGYGKALLEECEKESCNTNGIVVIVGKKKKPFLSEKSFFLKFGYEVCDSCDPDFELLVKKFKDDSPTPSFKESAKKGMDNDTVGIDIFYSPQCPFTTTYIELIKPQIETAGVPIRVHLISSREEAQDHFCPSTKYSTFINGKFHSNEILSPAKLAKLIECYKLPE